MEFGTGGTTVHATTGSDTYTFGSGADEIIYTSTTQSNGGSPSTDVIDLFVSGSDLINLSALSSSLIVQGLVTGAGDLANDGLAWYVVGSNTVVIADVDGNATADLTVNLVGTSLGLDAGDFVV